MNEFVSSIKVCLRPMIATLWKQLVAGTFMLSSWHFVARSPRHSMQVPGISWLARFARLYFVKDQVSVIGYNEGTIGHFRACLTHMGYSLKPRSWGLRPHDRRFAKTTGCRHFNVGFLTFLDALPSVTAYKLLAFLHLLASLASTL